MDVILASVKWRFALVYLDAIFIFSKTPEKHIDHVEEVLTLLQGAGVALNLKTCFFFTDFINYLRHVLRRIRLDIANHTAGAIQGLKRPRNITKLCSFLRLCIVFRRLVPNFARIAAPLNSELQKDWPKTCSPLNDKEPTFMTTFTGKRSSPPTITLPHAGKHSTLDKDEFPV